LWDGKKDLNLYSKEGSFSSQNVIDCVDKFCQKVKKTTIIVLDNASIHKSKLFKSKLIVWLNLGVEIFYLPAYSPQLNKIELLWGKMKYEWIEFDAYQNFENLTKYIQKISSSFGKLYTINFD
jgi:transposase